MRLIPLILIAIPLSAHAQGFGVCKPVAERTGEIGCWILVDHDVGKAATSTAYWHLDTIVDSANTPRANNSVPVQALGKTWLMTIDSHAKRTTPHATHVADIGPLKVKRGTAYSAIFMEAITTPGMTSAVHRHSGPEAWYTISGETCLETPAGTVLSHAGKPAIVPQGPPMFLTAIGTHQRRAITLILHEADKQPTMIATDWKPKGLCNRVH